jgi:hypothetical protein
MLDGTRQPTALRYRLADLLLLSSQRRIVLKIVVKRLSKNSEPSVSLPPQPFHYRRNAITQKEFLLICSQTERHQEAVNRFFDSL